MDNRKIIHKEERAMVEVIAFLESIYGPLVVEDGLFYIYLGIEFEYSVTGEMSVYMVNNSKDIFVDFPDALSKEIP